MRDPKGFVRLFDLNIPHMEYLDYYLCQLSKTQKYKNIFELRDMYIDAESKIDDMFSYRTNKVREIIDFIKSTNSYNELCYDTNLIDYPSTTSYQYKEGLKYLSIDLKSANWVSLKKYDPPHINELGSDYESFLSRFDVPQVFIKSKYLRQFIFGNINPKKISKIQRNIIQDQVRKYSDMLDVECVKFDEVIFKFDKFSDLDLILPTLDNNFRCKIFSIERVENFRIDHLMDKDGNLLSKEMIGVDGTQFYLKLKECITGEEINIKDLYFRCNGKLGIWNHDKLNVSINELI